MFAHVLYEFLFFYLTSFQVYYYFVLFYNCIISVYLVYVSYQKKFYIYIYYWRKLNRRYVFATLHILCSVTRLNSSEAHLKIFKSIPNKSTIQKKKKEKGTILYLSTTPSPS